MLNIPHDNTTSRPLTGGTMELPFSDFSECSELQGKKNEKKKKKNELILYSLKSSCFQPYVLTKSISSPNHHQSGYPTCPRLGGGGLGACGGHLSTPPMSHSDSESIHFDWTLSALSGPSLNRSRS